MLPRPIENAGKVGCVSCIEPYPKEDEADISVVSLGFGTSEPAEGPVDAHGQRVGMPLA